MPKSRTDADAGQPPDCAWCAAPLPDDPAELHLTQSRMAQHFREMRSADEMHHHAHSRARWLGASETEADAMSASWLRVWRTWRMLDAPAAERESGDEAGPRLDRILRPDRASSDPTTRREVLASLRSLGREIPDA